MPFADSREARIHYEAHGEGEPLLLVMGYGLSSDAWGPMLGLLGGYRAIVLDNRGTGGSDPPGEDFGMATMSGDAAAVLDAAGVDRAHVHGVSMGGMIAQQLVLDRPDKVHSVVLGCTSPSPVRFSSDPEVAVQLFQGTMLMESDPEAALDTLMPLVFSETFLAENPTVREMAKLVIGTARLAPGTALGMMKAFGDISRGTMWDVSDRLGEIRAPTLVQHGTADRLVPVEAGRYLVAHIAGAEYQEFEGAGHAYGMERPLESFPRMMQFLMAHPMRA